MLKYFTIVTILITSCYDNHKTKILKADCDRFKNGIFFFRGEDDPTLYKIKRLDSLQTEFIGKTGNYVNLKIKWTGDCSYELTFINQHINGMDSATKADQPILVKVDITKIKNDTCFVVSTTSFTKQSGVLYIDRP
jgi:hypothetical protein